MTTSLLKAVRITIHADSDPARQVLFADLRRTSLAVRLVHGLHGRLGRNWASSMLVSGYGLLSYLETRDPSKDARLLLVAVHANAWKQLARVGSWFGPGAVARLRIGTKALLHPSAFVRGLGLLAATPRLLTNLRVVHAVNRRHDFLVSCRVARAIACYARASTMLRTRRWGAVVVSSDTNPEEIGFAAAARACGVPSVFIAHGYPSPFGPPLDFSLSMLEGEAALEARRTKGAVKGEVVLLGLEGESVPLDPGRLERAAPVIGVFGPKVVDWTKLAETIDVCRKRFGAREVVVRWHPNMFGAPRLAHVMADRSRITETSREDRLLTVLSRCDWVIADLNSNVHLEALKLGAPSIAVRDLGLSPGGRVDIYGFEAHRVVFPTSAFDQLSLADVAAFYSGDWVRRFSRYDAAYLRPPDRAEEAARRAIDRVAAHPSPSVVRRARGGSSSRLLGVVVSAVLLAALYRTIDLAAVWAALRRAHPGWLVISVGMIAPLTLIRAIRFRWVSPVGAVPSVAEALRLTLVASALNVFVPAKAGDLVKSFFMIRRGGAHASVAVAVVVYERLADLFALIFWCLVGWIVARPLLRFVPPFTWPLLGLFGACCGAMVLSRRAADLLPVLGAALAKALPGTAKKLGDLAAGWPALHRDLDGRRMRVVLLSMFLWLAQLTQFWFFAIALSIAVPLTVCMTFAAVALMAGQLPLTFAGVGARDVALVATLSGYAPPESAAAMGVLAATRNFLPPLAGLTILQPYLAALADAGREWKRR